MFLLDMGRGGSRSGGWPNTRPVEAAATTVPVPTSCKQALKLAFGGPATKTGYVQAGNGRGKGRRDKSRRGLVCTGPSSGFCLRSGYAEMCREKRVGDIGDSGGDDYDGVAGVGGAGASGVELQLFFFGVDLHSARPAF